MLKPYVLYLAATGLLGESRVEQLVAQLDKATPEHQRELMSALLDFAPEECGDPLDPDLARLGVPAIAARLVSSDEELAQHAANVLAYMGTRAHDAKGPLRKALDDERSSVRIAAAKALARISASDGELILPIVLDALSSPSLDVFVHFPYLGYQTAPVVPTLARYLSHPDVAIAQAAASVLKGLGAIAQEARPELIKATHHSDGVVRLYSLLALAECGCVTSAHVEELEQLLDDDDHRVREAAPVAVWFARNNDGDALDNLLDAVDASAPSVRETAVLGLRHFWSTSDEARTAIGNSVNDSDGGVREAGWQLLSCPYE